MHAVWFAVGFCAGALTAFVALDVLLGKLFAFK